VAGIGYVETAAQHVVDQLGKYGMTVLSESDFRRAFAETILAGYVSPQDKENSPDAVLTTGIRTMTDDETNVVWYANPVFSHCILHAKASETDGNQESETKAKALPVTEKLLRSANKEEAIELLQGKSKRLVSGHVPRLTRSYQSHFRPSCASFCRLMIKKSSMTPL
jgi:hybrid polyketide synthase/nonribosomal peptide synthetase ACE1